MKLLNEISFLKNYVNFRISDDSEEKYIAVFKIPFIDRKTNEENEDRVEMRVKGKQTFIEDIRGERVKVKGAYVVFVNQGSMSVLNNHTMEGALDVLNTIAKALSVYIKTYKPQVVVFSAAGNDPGRKNVYYRLSAGAEMFTKNNPKESQKYIFANKEVAVDKNHFVVMRKDVYDYLAQNSAA